MSEHMGSAEIVIYLMGIAGIPLTIIFLKKFDGICTRLTRVETKLDMHLETKKVST